MFDDDADVVLWRGVMAAMKDDWPLARRYFSAGSAAVAKYPPEVRGPMRLHMARAWLQGGDIAGAEAEMRAINADKLKVGGQADAEIVRALIEGAKANREGVLNHLRNAVATGDRLARARAEMTVVEFELARKEIKVPDAIEKLERMRFIWRGDNFEFRLLRRLADLYYENGDLRMGVVTSRQLLKLYPKAPEAAEVARNMAVQFARLFTGAGVDAMTPLEALALFYEYRELTPAGREGDEIVERLADKLVAVDLLNRAAELLDYQIQYRADGVEKARVGMKLAAVALVDGRPDAAIGALRKTQVEGSDPALVSERRRLEAKALADQEKFAEALRVLISDTSRDAELLRSDIYWRAKEWASSARAMENILGNRWQDEKALTGPERKQVLQWAVSLSLANDAARLEQVRGRFSGMMTNTPEAEAFNVVTSSIARSATGTKEIAAAISQVGQFEAFLSSYREKLARGGLNALN
jgi:hypothetical protein